MSDLPGTAKSLVEKGKGIFAADASPHTIGKKLMEAGIAGETEEDRRKYREVIFTTPGLEAFIGGIILHDESTRQKTDSGELFVELIKKSGIMPGVKVDGGTIDMDGFPGEKIAEGLDGLGKRLTEYVAWGAKLTKWRAVIAMGENIPTRECVKANALLLARFAAISQAAGLVPVVEPEVLMDGDHSIDVCQKATEMVGRMVFEALEDQRVDLAGMLYKPNMVVAGKDCSKQASVEEVAEKTVETMNKIVSVRVPGIVFLSGGQEAKIATARLNAIAKAGAGASWRWAFSFERALEGPVMANMEAAHKILLHRARMNSLASLGRYNEEEDK